LKILMKHRQGFVFELANQRKIKALEA